MLCGSVSQASRLKLTSPMDLFNPGREEADSVASNHPAHCPCKGCELARNRLRLSTQITSLNLVQEASVDQLLDKAAATASGPASTGFPTSAEGQPLLCFSLSFFYSIE